MLHDLHCSVFLFHQVSDVWFSSSSIMKQAPFTPTVKECPLEIADAEVIHR